MAGDSSTQELTVSVRCPRTENRFELGSYITYEIIIKTNKDAFRLQESKVRRRYSEFEWLREQLSSINVWHKPPDLPPKRIIWRPFNDDFIDKRREGLEKWIYQVLSKPEYLSNMALHLFLQAEITLDQIKDYMNGKMSEETLENLWMNNGKLYHYQPYNPLHAYEPTPPTEIVFTPDEISASVARSVKEEVESEVSILGHVASIEISGDVAEDPDPQEPSLDQQDYSTHDHRLEAEAGAATSDSGVEDRLREAVIKKVSFAADSEEGKVTPDSCSHHDPQLPTLGGTQVTVVDVHVSFDDDDNNDDGRLLSDSAGLLDETVSSVASGSKDKCLDVSVTIGDDGTLTPDSGFQGDEERLSVTSKASEMVTEVIDAHYDQAYSINGDNDTE